MPGPKKRKGRQKRYSQNANEIEPHPLLITNSIGVCLDKTKPVMKTL
jgi:hypothetical protein